MEQLLLNTEQACQVLQIGETKARSLMHRAEDPLPTIKWGRKVLIPVEALKQWIDRETNRGAWQ